MQQGVLRIIGAATGDNWHAPAGLLNTNFNNTVMLCIGQRRGLARGPAWHKSRAALLDLPIDQLAKSGLIQRPIAKRSH